MSTGLGDRIKKRRTELGWSQEELARQMGLKSKSTICKIEKGEDNLTTTAIRKYADALQTTPSVLMGWEDEQQKTPEELKRELEHAVLYNILINSLSAEEQEEIREIVKLLLSLPRSERQFLRDWLASRRKQT